MCIQIYKVKYSRETATDLRENTFMASEDGYNSGHLIKFQGPNRQLFIAMKMLYTLWIC